MTFEKIKKNFGFGMMRLPTDAAGVIDSEQVKQMVDLFIGSGFNYFDTAHGYHEGKSEEAVRECLAERYPREAFVLTDKLTAFMFDSEDDIYKVFEEQLKICGVDYFDFYLMHSQGKVNYDHFKRCNAYAAAQKLKAQGKIKHVGLSFHDSAEFLDTILTENPEVEAVQIQLNYVDFDDPGVQSRKCLEVCLKHGKPVIVMEPVKGGSLVRLPKEADDVLRALNGGENAGYALRFAAGQEGVFMTLSGMSSLEQMRDNIGCMREFKPLNDAEKAAVSKVGEVFRSKHLIQCTGCRYCIDGCPKRILIADLFSDMNAKKQYGDWNSDFYYGEVHTGGGRGKASDCIRCGKCEQVCPQHLKIRDLLEEVAKTFERGGA